MWLGYGVVVLGGVLIRKGAVIGADSTATGDIASGVIPTDMLVKVIHRVLVRTHRSDTSSHD